MSTWGFVCHHCLISAWIAHSCCQPSHNGQCNAGNDQRANHAFGIQAPLTRVVATPCYRAPEVSPTPVHPSWLLCMTGMGAVQLMLSTDAECVPFLTAGCHMLGRPCTGLLVRQSRKGDTCENTGQDKQVCALS